MAKSTLMLFDTKAQPALQEALERKGLTVTFTQVTPDMTDKNAAAVLEQARPNFVLTSNTFQGCQISGYTIARLTKAIGAATVVHALTVTPNEEQAAAQNGYGILVRPGNSAQALSTFAGQVKEQLLALQPEKS